MRIAGRSVRTSIKIFRPNWRYISLIMLLTLLSSLGQAQASGSFGRLVYFMIVRFGW